MSFIYDDKNLLAQLLKAGQTTNQKEPVPTAMRHTLFGLSDKEKAEQAAQQAEQAGQQATQNEKSDARNAPAFEQDRALILQWIDNLLKDAGGPQKGSNEIGTDSDGDVALKGTDLDSLGALTDFVAKNKITVGGVRAVYLQTENPQDKQNYQLYQAGGSAGLSVADPAKVTNGYLVNKALLTQYIISLQGKQAKNPNPIMGTKLNKLVQESNRLLDTQISSEYKDPQTTIPGDQPIDWVPGRVSLKNPSNEQGPTKLTLDDLKSDTAFNMWAQKNKINVENEDGSVSVPTDEKYNRCSVLQVLHNRASYQMQSATTDELKARSSAYAKQVETLAAAIPCSLTGVSRQQQTGQQGEVTAQTYQELAEALPFDRDTIDFGKIRTFFELYEKVIRANQDPKAQNRIQTVSQSMDQAEQSMGIASGHTKTNMQSFPMNISVGPDQVKSWLQTPEGQHYGACLNHLSNVLTTTFNVIRDLSATHAQQVGAGPLREQESIYNSQFSRLRDLQRSVGIQ